MNTDLSYALLITLIGMSLVFGAIILLWGLMALLVRLSADDDKSAPATDWDEDSRDAAEGRLKQQAAAAAVAVALSRSQEAQAHHFPLPPTAIVSAWQAVMRAQQFRQRGPIR